MNWFEQKAILDIATAQTAERLEDVERAYHAALREYNATKPLPDPPERPALLAKRAVLLGELRDLDAQLALSCPKAKYTAAIRALTLAKQEKLATSEKAKVISRQYNILLKQVGQPIGEEVTGWKS